MEIESPSFKKGQIASNWQNLRADALAAANIPAGTKARIRNNAVTLWAKINDAWVPVMASSMSDMRDWANMRDYDLKLSIKI